MPVLILFTTQLVRLQKVNGHIHTIHELSVVMSFDFLETVNEIHPSLAGQTAGQSKSISNGTLASLPSKINSLKEEKEQRLLKVRYSIFLPFPLPSSATNRATGTCFFN